jgi:multifunctional 2-oxoglutarate metabolism enzyme
VVLFDRGGVPRVSEPVPAAPGKHASVPSGDIGFGVNEWLVEETYQRYRRDPSSVGGDWAAFFTAQGATRDRSARSRAAERITPLRAGAARLAANMDSSAAIPDATSARTVAARLLLANRDLINSHPSRTRTFKISVTQLIGYAMVRALRAHPAVNNCHVLAHGRAAILAPPHVNLGLAVDVSRPGHPRSVLVPVIRAAESLDFRRFRVACEDTAERARLGTLSPDDFADATVTLTNTGATGTAHSVPRLMRGQGAIVAVGAVRYPAEYAGTPTTSLADLAISEIVTLSCTYDHRIIQGATAAEFLRTLDLLLAGEGEFYAEVFDSLGVPQKPLRWTRDITPPGHAANSKVARVTELVNAYRSCGHLIADTNPLPAGQRPCAELDMAAHGLTIWDLERSFPLIRPEDETALKLKDILLHLRQSYCGPIGTELEHLRDGEQRRWIRQRIEHDHRELSVQEQLRVLDRLSAAEAFETFLQVKYVSQKRFSLEGGESLLVLLDRIISAAAADGLAEVAIGAPHRGRLNILTNVAGQPSADILQGFQHRDRVSLSGNVRDVSYNQGTRNRVTTEPGRSIVVSVAPNPSHLEAIGPVLEGMVRARQDVLAESGHLPAVLPVLIHGDAAFSGQGVAVETLNLARLPGFGTAGTVHVVINNQIGFTTEPAAARSSLYPTDVAHAIGAPVFHVNGDDPEACARVARIAFEFRQRFKQDAVIDLVCFRRRGHNEADDASVTQPLMYQVIEEKPTVRETYASVLTTRRTVSSTDSAAILGEYTESLRRSVPGPAATSADPHQKVDGAVPTSAPSVSRDVIDCVVAAHANLPAGFTPHRRVAAYFERRNAMTMSGDVDWAMAETIAFGSLLLEGIPVRLTGEDSQRGTFAQRHHVIVDQANGEEYAPLAHLSPSQAAYYVYDSPLSEYAVLGFQYGYSVARPRALVLWEAQYGDFGNGAQTIIDEFISSGEARWNQRSAIALLLPHGFEGQGQNHSSARIERYLQLCANGNLTVACPSRPSSYFHLLRQQAHDPRSRPLVVFTPKSMLRRREAVSAIDELTLGQFISVIDDEVTDKRSADRILVCSGKIYWDLLAARASSPKKNVAILRMEMLYPLPAAELSSIVGQYPRAATLHWVQEEPANQGAWQFLTSNLPRDLRDKIQCVARPASPSSTAETPAEHALEQRRIVDGALGLST